MEEPKTDAATEANEVDDNPAMRPALKKIIAKYKEQILDGPIHVCTCCGCLHFEHFVKNLTEVNLSNCKIPKRKFCFVVGTTLLCKRCLRNLLSNKLPSYCLYNGLEFPKVPISVTSLNNLEQRMVSPYLCSMQVRELTPHALNSQLGMKGTVVYIPNDLNNLLESILPREFDKMSVMMVQLKRNLKHISHYMFDKVKPYKVIKSLTDLVPTPLYLEKNISINQEYVERYKDAENLEVAVFDNETIVDYTSLNGKSKSSNDHEETDSEISDSDFDESNSTFGNAIEDDEVLIQDNSALSVLRTKIVIAPGQEEHPAPWHTTPHIEELSFPSIYGGHTYNLKCKITYKEIAKSEILRYDRRASNPEKILYSAKKVQEKQIHSKINIAVRKHRNKELSVEDIINPAQLKHLWETNEIFSFLEPIRTTPAYLNARKRDLFAMMRQQGCPHIFLSISTAERKSPELLRTLYYLAHKKLISLEQASELEDSEKTLLIKKDPVTCARYFCYKTDCLFNTILKNSNGPFEKNPISDYFIRTEFQNCGSPHLHIFLYLDKAPACDLKSEESTKAVVNFVNLYVSANGNTLSSTIQKHRHTSTCRKKNSTSKRSNCRFGFPKPIFDETKILQPIDEPSINDKKNYNKIQLELKKLSIETDKPPIDQNEFLTKYLDNMTEMDYINAIRSSLEEPKIFLKRNSREININNYNETILPLINTNMDIQFILDPYACISYIVHYVSKPNTETIKLIRQMCEEMNETNHSYSQNLYKIANIFTNFTTISAQEAVFIILGLPICRFSRKCIFINTNRPDNRIKLAKSNYELNQLRKHPHSKDDLYKDDGIDKYAKRPQRYENVCLADYMANIKDSKKQDCDDTTGEIQNDKSWRTKSKIIRFCDFRKDSNENEYYREQIMLFIPWRNEIKEILKINCKAKYENENAQKLIVHNRKKYFFSEDHEENIDYESIYKEFVNTEISEDEENENQIEGNDLASQFNDASSKSSNGNSEKAFTRYKVPRIEFSESINKIFLRLNDEQKRFTLQILSNFKQGNLPFYYFLSGSAGVGKSHTLLSIVKIVQAYYQEHSDVPADEGTVMVLAPTGKAAFLVKGATIHHALSLPTTQYRGELPELSGDIANTIRSNLKFVKLIIIDEVSMLGKRMFLQIITRLQQIFGNSNFFANIPTIVSGDFRQLPPVVDTPLFNKTNKRIEYQAATQYWKKFQYYELTTIMRQKGDIPFINALNNFAEGALTKSGLALLNSRNYEHRMNEIPKDAIRLFFTNLEVDEWNEKTLAAMPGFGETLHAKHIFNGKLSKKEEDKMRSVYSKKKMSECQGLPNKLFLRENARYMITYNINFQDGLTNGTIGTLKKIDYEHGKIKTVYLQFEDAEIGKIQRQMCGHPRNEQNPNLVPINKLSLIVRTTYASNLQIIRCQFPLTPAEAITIHKAQGSTFKYVCLDIRDPNNLLSTSLLYVGLSRVTSIKHLFLIGTLDFSHSKRQPTLEEELKRLRTDGRLQLPLYKNYKNHFFTVYYHNVRSLRCKVQDIITDPICNQHDIMILAEANIHSNESVLFPQHREIWRSRPRDNDTPGAVICFAKNDVWLVRKLDVMIKNKKISLILIKNSHLYIISGYSSPNIPNCYFRKYLSKMLKRIPINASVILIGDFNIDIKEENQKKVLDAMLNQYKMKTALPSEWSTTDYNSHLDVIYTNLSHYHANRYVTYFSDHDPVYIQIPIDWKIS